MPHAFRCKTCGHLCPAEHAGERDLPGACPVCKAGIEFDTQDKTARDSVVKEIIAASTAGDGKAMEAAVKKLHNLPLKKTFKWDNWEVLADASPERLEELGLKQEEVEKHSPFKTTWKDGKPIHRRMKDGTTVVDTRDSQHHERVVGDGAASAETSSGVVSK